LIDGDFRGLFEGVGVLTKFHKVKHLLNKMPRASSSLPVKIIFDEHLHLKALIMSVMKFRDAWIEFLDKNTPSTRDKDFPTINPVLQPLTDKIKECFQRWCIVVLS